MDEHEPALGEGDEGGDESESSTEIAQYPWLLLGQDFAGIAAEWRRTFIFEKMADRDWTGTALVEAMMAIDTWLSTGAVTTAEAKVLTLRKC
jgi:hypothetical protein